MPGDLKLKKTLLSQELMGRSIRRMAEEIVAQEGGVEHLLLVGIRTRGVPLAERLAEEIEAGGGEKVAIGTLDITLYRDDLSTIGTQAVLKETILPEPIDDRLVILCDDVLFTGRTVRAALVELADYGRPKAVRLAVLVDRGGRELPIQADFVGYSATAGDNELIEVRFEVTDGDERVVLMEVEADHG